MCNLFILSFKHSFFFPANMGTNVSPQITSRNWYNTVINVCSYILGKPVFLSAKVWTEET